jgi:hypothetical protein
MPANLPGQGVIHNRLFCADGRDAVYLGAGCGSGKNLVVGNLPQPHAVAATVQRTTFNFIGRIEQSPARATARKRA